MGRASDNRIIQESSAYIFVGDFFMNKKKKEKDFLVFTLIFQSVLCLVIFIGLFLIKDSHNKYFETIDDEFFENIGNSLDEVSEYKPDGLKPETSQEAVVVIENETVEYSISSEVTLSADITSSGGLDGNLENGDKLPDNISVNGYTLNKNMYLPLKGEITSEFGERIHPVSGEYSFHAGVDIAADTGTPIYAAFDGEVIVSDYDQWNGYYIKIIHEGEIMTVYCHCNELFVEAGDIVKAGDKIAVVGSTGISTGPHLHFEFRIDNISYDPMIALESCKDEV